MPRRKNDSPPAGFVGDAPQRRSVDTTLQDVAEGISTAVGQEFFHSLTFQLTKTLGIESALICRLQEADKTRVETVAVCLQGVKAENFSYPLLGTPCEKVMQGETCIFPDHVQERFPENHLLKEMAIEGYIGVPLFESNGKPFGLLAAMDRQPIQNVAQVEVVLRIFALRASAELERLDAERALQNSRQQYQNLLSEKLYASDARYRALAKSAPIGIIIMDRTGKIVYANAASTRDTALPREVITKRKHDDPAWNLRRPNGEVVPFDETPFSIALRTGKPVMNYEMLIRDGNNLDRMLSVNCAPIHDENGKIESVIFTGIDITSQKTAESSLKESEMRFRQLAEHIGEVFWMTNPNKQEMIYVSPAYEKIWGRSCESLYRNPLSFLEAIHPDDRLRVTHALKKQPLGTYQEEYRVVTPTGEVRWILDRAYPVKDDTGRVYRIAGIAEDITEEKLAQAGREEAMQFLDSIVENIPHMIFVKKADDLKFVRFNRAGEKLLGYHREDLIGKSDYDFFPKKEADFFTANDRNVLEGRKLIDIAEEPIETARKGSRLLHTKKIPIYDREGKPKYLLGISEDITERKELEKTLHLLARITSMSTEAVGASDKEGRMTFWNHGAEKAFGFSRGEVLGRKSVDFLIPSHKVAEADALAKLKHKEPREAIVDLRTERLHKDGHTVPVLLTAFPLMDESGASLGNATIYHDLTKIVEMEEKLVEQSKMAAIGKITAGIAHEIRNPLFGISSVAQILAKEIKGEKSLKELANLMLAETNRLKVLLEDLLLFARARRLEPRRLHPHDLWRRIHDLHRTLLKEKGLHLECKFDPEEDQWSCDEEQMYQVMHNLLLNAIQASPEKGTILVKSSCTSSSNWTFSIHNKGPHIREENIPHIFEPFFSTKAEGNGLGLSICKKIIEDHGGRISVQSSETEGTTFNFSIPEAPSLTQSPKTAKNLERDGNPQENPCR